MTEKKTRAKKPKDFAPHISPEKAQPCYVDGCKEAGIYKAPKSREQLNEYRWFCLEHIKEHNKQWDYFSGMKSEEIEAFIHDSVTGHRPTWSRESRLREHYFTLQDKLYEFLSGSKPVAPKPRIPAKTRNALAVMELDHPYTLKQLKTRYRTLVKKHHPDANKGDKESEEKFKKITSAYKYLSEQIKDDN
jgi:curved DNA-binding protein CbpA